MLMGEKNCDGKNDGNNKIWGEVLVDSNVSKTVPTLTVTLNDDTNEQQVIVKDVNKEKLSVLGNFQKRTLSRLSFKGENGPLLNRYILK